MYPHLSDEHEALRRQLRRFVDQEIFPIAAKIDEDLAQTMKSAEKQTYSRAASDAVQIHGGHSSR